MKVSTALTVLLLLSEGWTEVVFGIKVYKVTEGEDVTAECWFHFSGSTKTLCKNNCDKNEDILLETTKNTATKGRFCIRYENKFFSQDKMSVSIKKVQPSDSGRYWCKLDRSFIKDGSEEFEIKVIKAPVNPPVTTTTSTTVRPTHDPGPDPCPDPGPGSSPDPSLNSSESSETPAPSQTSTTPAPLLYVGLTLAVIVIVFAVSLLILCKKKNKNKSKDFPISTEYVVPEVDREYEEVPEQQVQSRSTGDSDIYSLASAPAQTQGDTVLYSEVNVNIKEKSAPHSQTEAVIYSTVRNEEALYSTVSKR